MRNSHGIAALYRSWEAGCQGTTERHHCSARPTCPGIALADTAGVAGLPEIVHHKACFWRSAGTGTDGAACASLDTRFDRTGSLLQSLGVAAKQITLLIDHSTTDGKFTSSLLRPHSGYATQGRQQIKHDFASNVLLLRPCGRSANKGIKVLYTPCLRTLCPLSTKASFDKGAGNSRRGMFYPTLQAIAVAHSLDLALTSTSNLYSRSYRAASGALQVIAREQTT